MISSLAERIPGFRGIRRLLREQPRTQLSKEEYLGSLSQKDRKKVGDFIDFIPWINSATLVGVSLAITAVGSTTKSETQRTHPLKDIDLRILNSALPNSRERTSAVATIRNIVRDYLVGFGIPFEEKEQTVLYIDTMAVVGVVKEIVSFKEFYNSDPSFMTQSEEGLPLHISISGVDNYDLDTYLKEERRQKQSTVVLFDSRTLSSIPTPERLATSGVK